MMANVRTLRRPALWIGLVILGVALCAGPITPAQAQGGTGQPISVGDIVNSTLDSQNFVRLYRFLGSAGDTVNVDASTQSEALALVVILTDQNGNVVAQDIDTETPTTATIPDTQLPNTGSYYIVVMRGSGAEGDASGSFTLQLGGIQQVGGQTVTLAAGGITIEMGWNAAVNLNLEVRDPVGGSVQFRSPGTPSGGVLDADVNAVCDTATANRPTEFIGWPAGSVPAGSYEIIVYYADACDVGGPQVFTLNTSVNDQTAQTLTGTLNPGQEYLARLILDTDGTWTLQNGGVNAGLNVSLFRTQIAAAESVALGSTVSGLITNNTPAEAYTFDATSGTTVNIAMNAQTGSLDTYLALLGPDGLPLAENDDAVDTTNSAISRTLASDGTYTVIATRYALTIGGTEGEYTLSLTQSTTITGDAGTTIITGVTTATPSVTLPEGAIEITLQWATNADIQLLVRDPLGESVYDDFPTILSGGVLASDGNVNCDATTTSPVSYIYWPPNRLLPGTYEIEVWYQNQCSDTTPVNFGLSVVVQGQTVLNTTQPASLDSRYMITFTVQQDGTVIAGTGGFFNMTTAATLNYQTMLASATPMTYGQTVSGSITDQRRFVVYSFDGQQGEVVTIGMEATGGTLDPALYLISPDGLQVTYNDDVTSGENANSVISEATLPSSGTFYIIATHYGLNFGGTQGTYNLSLVQD